MTRFERISRELHRIIESAILDHGYVLRTYDQRSWVGDRYDFSSTLDPDDRSCCVKGALELVEHGYQNVCTGDEARAVELGFEGEHHGFTEEHGYYRKIYPDFYALGQDIRERYTVSSEAVE